MAHLNHIENYRTYDISSGIPEIKWTDVDLVDFYNVSMECVGLEIASTCMPTAKQQTPSTASRLRSLGPQGLVPDGHTMRMLTLTSNVIPV